MQKHASVFYEIFVRSFADSNGDGVGDIPGIISKLDYLQDLGIEGIWLTPIFRSPSYHKYDCVNYYEIDPEFGTEKDLICLVNECHNRNIKLVLDLVLNHTSSAHPWFISASSDENSPYRDYYFWSSPPEIKAKGIEKRPATDDSGVKFPWHWSKSDRKYKYYGMFWKEMPDLNFHCQTLREEAVSIATYWLQRGIDGFRLDAAKHLFPFWEDVSLTIDFWRYFRQELQRDFPDVYLIGEIWDSPAVVAPYFKAFDACFNIDLSFDLKDILSGSRVDSFGIFKKLLDSRKLFSSHSSTFLDAVILSNHDQNRIGSVLHGDLSRMKLAANLLLTLPGQPYLYYGEEIGMLGEKPDEHIREPFPWRDGTETHWIIKKFNGKLRFEELLSDSDSLIYHYRRLIHYRKSRGLFLSPERFDMFYNQKLVIFHLTYGRDQIWVVHNLGELHQKFDPPSGTFVLDFSIPEPEMVEGRFLIPACGLLILADITS